MSVFDDFGAGVDVVAFYLVEFDLFAVGGELGSNDCALPPTGACSFTIQPVVIDFVEQFERIVLEMFWTCFLRFIVFRYFIFYLLRKSI